MKTEANILKLTEVRAALKMHKKEDLEFIVAEIYKMLPKEKKIDYNIAQLIKNPAQVKDEPKKRTNSKHLRSFEEIQTEVENFVSNAYEQNYLIPNRNVQKSDRSKWRFVVKRLYKELIPYGRKEEYRPRASGLLEKIYEVLCYSCGYQLFSAYDSFESVGIEQTDFFRSVIDIYEKFLDKDAFIKKSITLIINNYLNRYTLYSGLIIEFIECLNIPDLHYRAIEFAKQKWEEIKMVKAGKSDGGSQYEKTKKLNNLTEIIFRSYAELDEFDNAIAYFTKHQIEHEQEILLYVLIQLLMGYNKTELVLNELTKAENDKIKLRERLLKLKVFIEKNDKLPKYL